MDTKDKKRQTAQTRRSAGTGAQRREAAGTSSRTQPRKKTGAQPQYTGQTRRRTTAAQKRRSAAPKRRQQPIQRQPAPEVVYTAPMPFNRTRFLLRLVIIVTVVLALTFGISIFFKVRTVTVSGTEKYTPWMVMEASGIQEGDTLLTISKPQAGGKIKTALPYVKSVRIGIKLPDTVNIVIEELDAVYAVQDGTDQWWLITADGSVVEQTDDAGNYPQILGIRLNSPSPGNPAAAMDGQPTDDTTDSSEEPVTATGSAGDRLSAALSILQYLEANSVFEEVASVDVTDLSDMELWYGDRYQVKLGSATQLGYKISAMKAAIDQLSDYQSGVLDVSFTTWPDQPAYTPF